MRICANCGCSLENLVCTGYSSIYHSLCEEIELCEPCFQTEDAKIEAVGTNDLPTVLAHYKRILGIK